MKSKNLKVLLMLGAAAALAACTPPVSSDPTSSQPTSEPTSQPTSEPTSAPHVHGNATHHDAAAGADCQTKGTIEYWECECGDKFADEALTQPIESVEGEFGPHIFGEWTNATDPTCTEDGELAHKDCNVCGNHFNEDGELLGNIVVGKLGHSYDWTVTTPATTTAEGEATGICNHGTCGDTITKKILPLPTVTATGNTFSWSCEGATGYKLAIGGGTALDVRGLTEYTLSSADVGKTVSVSAYTTDEDYYEAGSTTLGATYNPINKVPASMIPFNFDDEIVIPGNSELGTGYNFGNWCAGDYKIVRDADTGKVAAKIQQYQWGLETHLIKDVGYNDSFNQAGTYVFSFDVMASETAKTAFNQNNEYGNILFNAFNESCGTEVHSIRTNDERIKTNEFTTIEFELTITAEQLECQWMQFGIWYWAEGSIDDNYILVDNMIVYAKDDENKTNLDLFQSEILNINEDVFPYHTLYAQSGWDPYCSANFENTDTHYVVKGLSESYAVITQKVWGQSSVLTRALSDALAGQPGDYIFSLRIKSSIEATRYSSNKGFSGVDVILYGEPGGQYFEHVKVRKTVTTDITTSWQTIEIPFTIAADKTNAWMHSSLWYWAEGSIHDNSICVDDYKVFRADDEERATDVGTQFNADFQVALTDQYAGMPAFNWRVGFAAESMSVGSKIVSGSFGNNVFKLSNTGEVADRKDTAFDFAVGANFFEANKMYRVSCDVNAEHVGTHIGAIGLSVFSEKGTLAEGKDLFLWGADDTAIRSGWVHISVTFLTNDVNLTGNGWQNLYVYAFLNDGELDGERGIQMPHAGDYMLFDNFTVETVSYNA